MRVALKQLAVNGTLYRQLVVVVNRGRTDQRSVAPPRCFLGPLLAAPSTSLNGKVGESDSVFFETPKKGSKIAPSEGAGGRIWVDVP